MTAGTSPETLKTTLTRQIEDAGDMQSLDAVRVHALGKKGVITGMMKTLGAMSPEERKTTGAALNVLKDEIAALIDARHTALKKQETDARLSRETADITLDARPERKGTIHPLTQVMDEIIAIFADMGFSIHDGPDIEDDFHNFTALNFPPHHPAREMHDTFYLPDAPEAEGDAARRLLRTHTSTCQIRAMTNLKPPMRKIVMGRVYRAEAMDATHSAMFYQLEGMAIDTHIHMGHLKGCLIEFCRKFFDVDELPIRFRPSFFPFTEPSAEVDICGRRDKNGLTISPDGDWMEILGSGMIHPNVLRNCGIDPDKYQGFAFGMGIERLTMLKYGIQDLRQFYEADTRWNAYYGGDPLHTPDLASGL